MDQSLGGSFLLRVGLNKWLEQTQSLIGEDKKVGDLTDEDPWVDGWHWVMVAVQGDDRTLLMEFNLLVEGQ